jgi:hypothetical protein
MVPAPSTTPGTTKFLREDGSWVTVDVEDAVHLTGNQTVAGIKTFTSSPVVPTPSIEDDSTKVATTAWVTDLVETDTATLQSIANGQVPSSIGIVTADNIVTVSGTQGITGAKTFSVSPTVPTPPANDDSTKVATTEWVNDKIGDIDFADMVQEIATGSADGTISVDGTDVAVAGLGSAAYTASTDYAASGHTHTDTQVSWGTTGIAESISCADAGCIDDFGHNKLAYFGGVVDIEYTTDGGTTWADYGASDDNKWALLTRGGFIVYAGKNTATATAGTLTDSNVTNYKGRVTLHSRNAGGSGAFYTRARKLLVNFSTEGGTGCKVTLEARTIANYNNSVDAWNNLGTYDVGGWSGWNSLPLNITFGGGVDQTDQYADVRITFWATGVSTSYPSVCHLIDLRLIGDTNWSVDPFAYTGHLYAFDRSKNATFPADVKGASFQATSDIRKKTDIKQISNVDLSGVKTYNYILKDANERHTGLIAQEVQNVIPDAVTEDEQGFLSLDYNAVVAVLVDKINRLEAKIATLESKL